MQQYIQSNNEGEFRTKIETLIKEGWKVIHLSVATGLSGGSERASRYVLLCAVVEKD